MIRSKCFNIVIEELKQNIKATVPKRKRSTERNKKRYKENRILMDNERQFSQSLTTTSGNMNIAPNKEEIKLFWEGI